MYLNASQAFILTNVIGVNANKLGDATGSLALYDELVSLAAVLVWGVLSDKIGRRIVYTLGFLIIGVATIVFPLADNLYPQLLLARLLFAIGAASTSSMLTAVLADFALDANRGFISGAVGLASGLGALIALFVFLPLPVSLEPRLGSPVAATRVSYAIVGGISILFCVPLWFFLRTRTSTGDSSSLDEESQGSDATETKEVVKAESADKEESNGDIGDEVDRENNTKSAIVLQTAQTDVTVEGSEAQQDEGGTVLKKGYLTLAKEGVLAAKNPIVALGYIGGFVARADSISLTLFITLYVNRYFVDKGVCDVFDPSVPNGVIKQLCPESFRRASLLSGTAQTCALVGSLFFAILSDRIPREISLAIASALGFIGFLLFSIVDDAKSSIAIVAIVFMGLGQIGMIVVSLSLVTISDVPADIRGSVAGVYSFFGAVGILLSGRLGGALFDSWREIAPFVLLAIFHAASFVASIVAWLIARRCRNSSVNEEMNTA